MRTLGKRPSPTHRSLSVRIRIWCLSPISHLLAAAAQLEGGHDTEEGEDEIDEVQVLHDELGER